MSSTTVTPAVDHAGPVRRPLLRVGTGAGLAAALATTVVAVLGRGAGISLDIAGEAIPLYGFAQLTFLAALLGVGIAALCRRTAAPRRRFLQVTVALTGLSFVPDVLADAALSTKLLLMTTHLVAAAVVVPALARRVQ
jgi:Family of unknown function (DUF6069)